MIPTMTPMTVHENAKRLLDIYGTTPTKRGPRKLPRKARRKALEEAARKAVDEMGVAETRHLERDFRPGIGSGRSADWHVAGFRYYATTAEAVHRGLGLSGEDVRRVTRYLRGKPNRDKVEDLPRLDDSALGGLVGQIRREGRYQPYMRKEGEHVEVLVWLAVNDLVVRPLLAEREAKYMLDRLHAEPARKISGYLADSILSWREGKRGYEGCAGCESYLWLREHPETWDFLMSRAPTGVSGPGFEQVFPHERERRAKLLADGWCETLRMNDSVFTPKNPLLS